MKFASIYLSNYIGIYNGMRLNEIFIDMSQSKNRITIIRGDNGSGKSTLAKAMSVFPDPNDSFIPGLPAKKEIVLVDNATLYRLTFIHGIKNNGDREVTKAYITKTFGNSAVELNENGNVSSYKDILFNELGLDANFVALSQLSNDDRGLADKKPAERKRFVNSIISSLDTYNNIYKVLTKKSNNYKSLINGIVAKLNVLGDEATIETNLEIVEDRINIIQDKKDKAVADLARQQSIISLLDPDGSIQISNSEIELEMKNATIERSKIVSMIDTICTSHNLSKIDPISARGSIVDKKNSLMVQNQISRNSIDGLIHKKEIEAKNLNEKMQRLESLQSDYDYDSLVNKISYYSKEISDIEKTLSSIGISDILSISKDEYILALETLKELSECIQSFKMSTDFNIIEDIVSTYISNSIVPSRLDITENTAAIERSRANISNIEKEIMSINSKMSLLDSLSLRSSKCNDDGCLFIKEALEFSRTDPKNRLKELETELEKQNDLINFNNNEITLKNKYNDAVNYFAIIVREINKNGSILSKMPNGDMFEDKSLFFSRIILGYSFDYMTEIYKYIDYANLFDVYRQTKSILAEYQSELKIYESKNEIITSLLSDIDSINSSIDSIIDEIDSINARVSDIEKDIFTCQEIETAYDTLIEYMDRLKPIDDSISHYKCMLDGNKKKMNDINAALANCNVFKESINKYSSDLMPLMRERDSLVHKVQMMKDYTMERDELQANYEFIETIKYYSSPTTGIQLVFMELYMGKIISLANELLSLLFNGQFVIQPFVINESEFRIPCLGNGYINDDISSMSSSQIGMISMILSFSLLHNSSTKYNIIKLDEIDGPLDYNNRLFFTDVLNSIMDIMGTEQCIMISHNSELQIDNSDVILLKHDGDNTDYTRGNIIWSY